MDFTNEWREMSLAKRISLIASCATVLGLFVSLYSTLASSNSTTVNQSVNGSQNTIIGENSGTVHVNVGGNSSNERKLVLRNSETGSSLLLSEPDMLAVMDVTKHVCEVIAGTPVSLTGRKFNQNNMVMHELFVLEGECQGQKGWASSSVLSYE
ncbi:hypothetical protein ACV17F_000690 [Vibrio harveyi]